jgi:hypothetical protein
VGSEKIQSLVKDLKNSPRFLHWKFLIRGHQGGTWQGVDNVNSQKPIYSVQSRGNFDVRKLDVSKLLDIEVSKQDGKTACFSCHAVQTTVALKDPSYVRIYPGEDDDTIIRYGADRWTQFGTTECRAHVSFYFLLKQEKNAKLLSEFLSRD